MLIESSLLNKSNLKTQIISWNNSLSCWNLVVNLQDWYGISLLEISHWFSSLCHKNELCLFRNTLMAVKVHQGVRCVPLSYSHLLIRNTQNQKEWRNKYFLRIEKSLVVVGGLYVPGCLQSGPMRRKREWPRDQKQIDWASLIWDIEP